MAFESRDPFLIRQVYSISYWLKMMLDLWSIFSDVVTA